MAAVEKMLHYTVRLCIMRDVVSWLENLSTYQSSLSGGQEVSVYRISQDCKAVKAEMEMRKEQFIKNIC